MKISFVEDSSNGGITYFAIAQKEVYKGKIADELLFAELIPQQDGRVKIVWEDSWDKPVFYNELALAKSCVLAEHSSHTPHINGATYSNWVK